LNKENLKTVVNSIFTDTLMIFLALLVIPLILVQFFELTPLQLSIVECADWVIYGMFFLEFVMKVLVAENRIDYIKSNKLASAISLIIIVSPLFEFVSVFFEAAPLLRLFRISRIMRLGGIVGKTRTQWRKVNYKSYAIVVFIISAGFTLSFFKIQIFGPLPSEDEPWIAAFIQVIGIIYAILAAFMIVNAWTEVNSLDDTIRKETISLRNIYFLGLQFHDENVLNDLKQSILNYITSIIDAYWEESIEIDETDKKFIEISKSIEEFKLNTGKKYILLNNIHEEFRSASTQRATVLSFIAAKTPRVLWLFIIFLSFVMVFNFIIIDYANQWIATLIITLVSIAIAFVLVLIYDMYYPFKGGFWAMTPEHYLNLQKSIQGLC
jgi:hypothetical protein